MKKILNLTIRNMKMYFSDKSLFFTSLVTPGILLVLYATFLGGIFEDSFYSVIPEGLNISSKVIKSLVSGEILASLLAVSCITVSFTSNMLMVNDRVNGTINDLNTSPLSNGIKSLSYFIASFTSTIIVNFVGLILCLVYTYFQGWLYSINDILILCGDILLLTLFGSALASVINYNLSSQGQVSAVGTIVSAGYGFICGAYMPISSFGVGLQKVLSFLPGTYGTSLIKNHSMSAAFKELANSGLPNEVIVELKKSLDCNITFFNSQVTTNIMYLIMIVSSILLILLFVFENKFIKRK